MLEVLLADVHCAQLSSWKSSNAVSHSKFDSSNDFMSLEKHSPSDPLASINYMKTGLKHSQSLNWTELLGDRMIKEKPLDFYE